MTMHKDRWLRILVVVLLLLNAAGLIEHAWRLPVAQAQIPDSGAQMQQQIELSRRTNELLTRIADRLDKGPVNVRVLTKEELPKDKP